PPCIVQGSSFNNGRALPRDEVSTKLRIRGRVKAPSELASSLMAAFDFGLPRFSSDPVSLRTSSISDRLSRFFLITFYNSFILNASSRCRVSQPGAHCHVTQEAKYETAHGDMVHHSGRCRQPS